jgi:ABC transport system ATP-binding/permease protein
MHRDLTVRQALYFRGRLRLPPDHAPADVRARVAAVVARLGLAGTEGVLIGSPERRGISGGQRRRVNLAMELLTDPRVLFLDEPTSGLSSADALVVMRVLRALADAGKVVVLTIHQPGREVFRVMDRLVVLGKDPGPAGAGRLAYDGPAFPDAIRFFAPRAADLCPDAVLEGLSRRPAAEWAAAYEASPYRRARPEAEADAAAGPPAWTCPGVPAWRQWQTLGRRWLALKARDRANTAILLAQAPVIAALIALVFGRHAGAEVGDDNGARVAADLGTALFLTALAAVWFGASNAVREVVGEWAVYHRERVAGLSLRAYVAAKFTVLGALCLLQCLVLYGVVATACGLRGPAPTQLGLLLLAALVGAAVGLGISAAARTSEAAIALLPVVLIPMVLLGGAVQPRHKMGEASRALSQAAATRWAFEGLLVSEAAARPTFRPPAPPGAPRPEPRDVAEAFSPAGAERGSAGASAALLGGCSPAACCWSLASSGGATSTEPMPSSPPEGQAASRGRSRPSASVAGGDAGQLKVPRAGETARPPGRVLPKGGTLLLHNPPILRVGPSEPVRRQWVKRNHRVSPRRPGRL